MIRTSTIPQQTDILISVPPNYVGKKIEILLYAIDEVVEEKPKKNTMAQFWGVISDETAQKLHNNVNLLRSEWE